MISHGPELPEAYIKPYFAWKHIYSLLHYLLVVISFAHFGSSFLWVGFLLCLTIFGVLHYKLRSLVSRPPGANIHDRNVTCESKVACIFSKKCPRRL